MCQAFVQFEMYQGMTSFTTIYLVIVYLEGEGAFFYIVQVRLKPFDCKAMTPLCYYKWSIKCNCLTSTKMWLFWGVYGLHFKSYTFEMKCFYF